MDDDSVSHGDQHYCIPSGTRLRYNSDYFSGLPDTPRTRKIMEVVLSKEELATFEPRQMGRTVTMRNFILRKIEEEMK